MINFSKILRRYPVALMVLSMAVTYGVARVSSDIDLFENLRDMISRHEHMEADEIVFFFFVTLVGVAIDQTRNVRRQRLKNAMHKGRIRAVRATMATVHDIVNNALNNLLLIRFEAEKSKALSPETLLLFEDLIEDTAKKLREIDELETLSERTLAPGLVRLELDRAARLEEATAT